MIRCDECGVYFFTPEGMKEHDGYCIGYVPVEVVLAAKNLTGVYIEERLSTTPPDNTSSLQAGGVVS